MDAEHRKQLEHNELRDWVERTTKSVREKPVRLMAPIAVIALLVCAVILLRTLFGTDATTASSLWVRLDSATDTKELESIAADAKGSPPGIIATVYRARTLLVPNGLDQLDAATPDARNTAATNVAEAKRLFEDLAKQTAKEDGLKFFHREALLSAAKAEEALCGVPKGGNPADTQGNLDKALALYQQLIKESPDSYQGKEAAARAKEIESKRVQIEGFYAQLAQQFAAKAMTSPNPLLTVPPVPTPTNPLVPPGGLGTPTKPTMPVFPTGPGRPTTTGPAAPPTTTGPRQ